MLGSGMRKWIFPFLHISEAGAYLCQPVGHKYDNQNAFLAKTLAAGDVGSGIGTLPMATIALESTNTLCRFLQ